jgi:predicted lactoylglutathione lyase
MIFVNLPVADVEKSTAFYEALGFVKNEQFSQAGTAASMAWSDEIVVMILSHEFFATFTPRPIADAKATTQVLIALSRDSRAEVDEIADAAASAGGTADIRPAQDMGFMYSRAFADPDGHIFEPVFMDMAAATAAFAHQGEATPA